MHQSRRDRAEKQRHHEGFDHGEEEPGNPGNRDKQKT
jgi:hypothetical protein